MNTYRVKEVFYSIQGEGFHSGSVVIFIRFSGCNLWGGGSRKNAICKFCDTDFVGTNGENGGIYSAEQLIAIINNLWVGNTRKFIVLTGGEPLLQVDDNLLVAFKAEGYYIAVETNGTIPVPKSIDWVCVSPKAGAKLVALVADELKLVYPQNDLLPDSLMTTNYTHLYLQPMDMVGINHNAATVKYCLNNPKWKISTQIHKILKIK